MVDLLLEIDPNQYKDYVVHRNNKKFLYVKLKKALYGTLKAALLFWKRLSKQLESWGFSLNPYDSCVANKDINGKQCTVLWHVDDLKISHEDHNVVSQVLQLIEAEFAKEAPLTITRGKKYDYLGMQICFDVPGKVQFSMIDYIRNILGEVPEDMGGESSTPAANHLFEVNNDNPTKLDKDKAIQFHHNVAKLLFLCKRARPDSQTGVSFLCTRV
jgi:Reverse transcriptase (RNA-dependent DNA polymerase)